METWYLKVMSFQDRDLVYFNQRLTVLLGSVNILWQIQYPLTQNYIGENAKKITAPKCSPLRNLLLAMI
jgi:hypothetical protein